jgi:hypothetical protein
MTVHLLDVGRPEASTLPIPTPPHHAPGSPPAGAPSTCECGLVAWPSNTTPTHHPLETLS